MMRGAIQVNAQGNRFANEHQGYSEQAEFVLEQPGAIAWNIYDERIHQFAMSFDDYREAVTAGAVRIAAGVSELADITGLPEGTLNKTLDDIGEMRDESGEDRWGRTFGGESQFEPPFYAVKVTGALFHTQGGPLIDASARVVNADGNPLGNIFAGGGAACGVSGPKASGYLSGNGLLSAIAFGEIAGRSAAAQILKREGVSVV